MTSARTPIQTFRPITTGAASSAVIEARDRRFAADTGWLMLSKIATSPAISVSSPIRTLFATLMMLR